MRTQAGAEGVTHIAMPRIGVGDGGLSWKKVRAIVEAVFGDWDGTGKNKLGQTLMRVREELRYGQKGDDPAQAGLRGAVAG